MMNVHWVVDEFITSRYFFKTIFQFSPRGILVFYDLWQCTSVDKWYLFSSISMENIRKNMFCLFLSHLETKTKNSGRLLENKWNLYLRKKINQTVTNAVSTFQKNLIKKGFNYKIINQFLEVVVQTTTYIQFAFVVLHSRGGSWELVDAFSLCCLTWHFWKILAAWSGEWGVVGSFCLLFLLELGV